MHIKPFKLERYFAKYEFSTKYLISSSDCDGYSLDYILACANSTERELWDNLKFSYTDSTGSDFLREAIKNHYLSINSDEIAVMSPGEANFILMNVLLKNGDEVVCMSPAYQSLYQVAESLGAKVKFWLPQETSDGFYFDPDILNELVSEKTKLIIVNFPHNPTGFVPNVTDLQKIVEIAEKYNIVLFSDEMYHKIIHDPNFQLPAICDMYENAVSLWGMAKSFGLAGMRFGWLATKRKDILNEIVAFKDYLSICNNAAGEVLTTIALNHSECFIDPNIKKILKNKAIFADFVEENSDLLDFYNTRAGSTAFVKLKSNLKSYEYCENLVNNSGIMMIPSEMFDYGSSHIRIGFGRENFSEVLSVWEAFIRE
ncbi:MAG: aminotransferase class I/II-fold pyridoxal phosphate-dependent enzyme [Bacteroidales bacterium]|nr:aminotransferase class I/II-fold pyridoxal phosphate-dependent enzyme [Bacteroidales bacterium]